MGAVLVIPRGTYSFGRMEVLDVVDGQQRLTTFQIFLAALRDLARTLGQSQTADLLGSLLLNSEGPQIHDRIERYKLYPTAYDRKLYCDLVDLDWDGLRKKYPDAFYKNGKALESAELPLRAWSFFRSEAESFINAVDTKDIDGTGDDGHGQIAITTTAVPLGTFRGQKGVVVSYLRNAKGPVTLDQVVADLTPTYEPLINDWAKTKAGGVRGSIHYHLRALQRLGQIELKKVEETPTSAISPESRADERLAVARLNALSAALLENFQVIVITLGEHDDAQVIFETLNAGGEPLAAMDLVRNDVFHRARGSVAGSAREPVIT